MKLDRVLKSVVLAVLLACVGLRAIPAQTTLDPGKTEAIEAVLDAPINAGTVAGASVAVAQDGRTILAKSFGKADLEFDVPMPADASFEIGSVTKQFTAASVLLLAERGKLAIDDEVTKYLPDYPTQGHRVTIRHLLTHTSGIKGYTEIPEFGDLMPLRKPPDMLVKMFSAKSFDFPPGDAMVYNNSGYFLLGLVIEKLSGQPYDAFVKQNIFDRLGMTSSYYCSESAIRHHRAHGYDTEDGHLILKRAISHAWPYSAGSLCSTASDLTTWLTALHGGRVLDAASYRAMTTPASLADGTKLRYGFGLSLADVHGHRAISHGGGINGFLSETEYYPDNRLSVVVLLNTAGAASPGDLAADIADVVLGRIAPPTATYSGTLSEFEGTYEGVGRGRPTSVTIAVDHGTLTMKGVGADVRILAYQSGETFGVGQTLVTFEREAGRVTRMRLDTPAGHYPLKRTEP